MAEQNLKLPDLDKPAGDSATAETKTDEAPLHVGNTTSTKETVIAFGGILVAAIIFFIIKNFVFFLQFIMKYMTFVYFINQILKYQKK